MLRRRLLKKVNMRRSRKALMVWYTLTSVTETWLGMALVLGGIALCVSGNGS